MRRFNREFPDGGDATTAVQARRNRGELLSWERAWWRNGGWHEVRRALWRIDDLSRMLPEVRREYLDRLRRYVLAPYRYPAPRLP